jgi:hypothetical protein
VDSEARCTLAKWVRKAATSAPRISQGPSRLHLQQVAELRITDRLTRQTADRSGFVVRHRATEAGNLT